MHFCINKNTLPLVVFLFSTLSTLFIQILFLGTHWSPFAIWQIKFNPEIVYVCLLAMFFLTLGNFLYPYLFRINFLRGYEEIPSLDQFKLIKLIKLNSIFLVIFLIITQVSLGHSWIYNLWSGVVRGPDVENAITDSIFGIHSILLILIFTSLILWTANFRLGLKNNRWLELMLVIAFISSLSQGKIQILFYFAVTYLFQQKESKLIKKIFILALTILIIFFITRLLRNQGTNLVAGFDTFLLFVVGIYLGSPIVNAAYILEHHALTNDLIIEFFKYMLPSRLYNETIFHSHFIDVTSPAGFIGHGLMLGSPFGLCLYSFLTGILIRHLAVKSSNNLTCYLFYPFLITSCLLVFLYDHFLNLVFFYIPMMLCYLVAKHLKIKVNTN